MPARSVCLVTLSPSEAGPGRFGRQASVTDIYHAMSYHAVPNGLNFDYVRRCPSDGQSRSQAPLPGTV